MGNAQKLTNDKLGRKRIMTHSVIYKKFLTVKAS